MARNSDELMQSLLDSCHDEVTASSNYVVPDPVVGHPWQDRIPIDMLKLIFTNFNFKELLVVRTVCKFWLQTYVDVVTDDDLMRIVQRRTCTDDDLKEALCSIGLKLYNPSALTLSEQQFSNLSMLRKMFLFNVSGLSGRPIPKRPKSNEYQFFSQKTYDGERRVKIFENLNSLVAFVFIGIVTWLFYEKVFKFDSKVGKGVLGFVCASAISIFYQLLVENMVNAADKCLGFKARRYNRALLAYENERTEAVAAQTIRDKVADPITSLYYGDQAVIPSETANDSSIPSLWGGQAFWEEFRAELHPVHIIDIADVDAPANGMHQ